MTGLDEVAREVDADEAGPAQDEDVLLRDRGGGGDGGRGGDGGGREAARGDGPAGRLGGEGGGGGAALGL